VLILFFFFVLFFYYIFYNFVTENVLREFTAQVVGFFLRLLGVSAVVDGYFIQVPGFTLEVIYECIGVWAMIVYSSFILAYPAGLRKKLVGVVLGVFFLFTVGIIRMISLAFAGMFYGDLWEYFHIYLWQLNLIIFVIILILLWVEKVVKSGRQWNKITFFVKFAVFLTILFMAWIPFAETFVAVKYWMVDFTYGLISGEKLKFPPFSFAYGTMINIVPFTALVLATPNIIAGKRIMVIATGVLVLFFIEVFTVDLILLLGGGFGKGVEIFSRGAGMIFFPVVLWIILLYRDIIPKKTEQKPGEKEKGYINAMKEILHYEVSKEKYTCPLCKKEQENIVVHLKSKHKKKLMSRKVEEFLNKYSELKLRF